MIKILPSAKLPLAACRGSEKERYDKAEKLCRNYLNRITEIISNKNIYSQDAEHLLKASFPNNMCIILKRADAGKIGTACIGMNQNDEIYGHIISVRHISGCNIIDITDGGKLGHETFHTADYVFNPKKMVREATMYFKKYLNNENEDFYKNNFYTKNRKNKKLSNFIQELKEQTKTFLSGKTNDEKINFLQHSRYRLQSEDKAYKIGNAYQKFIEEKFSDSFIYKEKANDYRRYNFKAKIKMIEDLLKEEIANERKTHAESIK